MLTMFKAFGSTISPPQERPIDPRDKVLVDPVTGAPVGLLNPNANGPDARFVPVDITIAQLASPTALMLDDIDATFRLNVAPYTCYRSNGQVLQEIGSTSDVIVPPGVGEIFYGPLTIASPQRLIVYGTMSDRAFPA